MKNKNDVYAIYARRSSEDEEKQIQSLDRQLDEINTLIEKYDLKVADEPFLESRTAFKPGREMFRRMVTATRKGDVNCWLCWHANRLSRNASEAGEVVQLMDDGHLRHIRTPTRIYYNTPNDKTMLLIELTMSKRDSDDKSELVRSGIRRKHKRGYPNGIPPVGFRLIGGKSRGGSRWAVDSKRFPLVKAVFDEFLKGKKSITGITEYARSIGLTSKRRHVIGGKPISRSSLHAHVLLNPVYAGFFFDREQKRYTFRPDLPRLITEEEHVKIRAILNSRNQGERKKRQFFAYKGFVVDPDWKPLTGDKKYQLRCDCMKKFAYRGKQQCPHCGAYITKLKSPVYRLYTYYTYRVLLPGLKWKTSSITEQKIEDYLISYIEKNFAISKQLRDWAVKHLDERKDKEIQKAKYRRRIRGKKLQRRDTERERIILLARKGFITQKELDAEMALIEDEYANLDEGASEKQLDWTEQTKEIVDLAYELPLILKNGSPKQKNDVLKRFRSNLVWNGEKLFVCNADSINLLLKVLGGAKRKNNLFEPRFALANKGQKAVFEDVRPVLRGGLDSFRTFFKHQKIKEEVQKIYHSEDEKEYYIAA